MSIKKRTKIVATIGPASSKPEILEQMIMVGMNVARINFSHGTYDSNGQLIDNIRAIGKKLNVPVGVMADLQGPRIRTIVEHDIEINKGQIFGIYDISTDKSKINPPAGGLKSKLQLKVQDYIGLDSPGIIRDINVENEILIEDGLMKIKIIEKQDCILFGEVLTGGIVKNHKGVNIPDAKLSIPAVTQKDERDLEYALKMDVDFVALSFVSQASDIENAREKIKSILRRDNNLPWIVSKIERKEAIKNIDELIKVSDVIMVARGDLGIELPETKVAIYQKEIIKKCLKAARPVIVATQMLNSMIENPLPTRAEVSDVCNAACDHTDATMLSGESANGKYPIDSVRIMAEIIRDTEQSRFDDYVPEHIEVEDHISREYSNFIANAWKMAKKENAAAILAVTFTGFTACAISNYRPERHIFIATESKRVYNQLSIVWGVDPYLLNLKENNQSFVDAIVQKAKKEKRINKGDKIVLVLGIDKKGHKIRSVELMEVE
ncbi:MAG TPA: pyruvate kinase [Patescibacteria group bacterium]|nr:pyruvate kinase [Patescibacteria group bacterium]